MTILRIYIAVLLLLCSLAGGAQVRPDQFPLQTNIGGFNFEIYSQYGGTNTKSTPYYMKLYYSPNIDSSWQAFTFTDSIGVADSLRMQFLKDNRGRVWYTDAQGDALLLKDTAQAVGNVYVLPTTADTSTVASPVEGDIAVVGSDTLLFYETYWLMFAGGAGGIYGGSGTVPASTWAELLGSLIFDIDSLGSFTVGDIDEKSTGAFISVSNNGGNDGQITLRSGSGGGYTDATVQINNYQLPGNTPTAEGLPSGDYFWIVSQAGVRKGQDSTGWIHIDSLLSGYPTGTGTSGTLPIWTGANTLGNSSLTEASGVLSSSLTGALKLPAGTDAQDPVWSAGMLRYNTTTAGFQGYNGAERYLPWADSDNWSSGLIPFSDGAKLTTSSNFVYSSDELRLSSTDKGFYRLQLEGGMIIQGSTGSLIETNNSSAFSFRVDNTSSSSLGGIMGETNNTSGVGGQFVNASTGVALETGFRNHYNGTSVMTALNIGNRRFLTSYYNHTHSGTGGARAISWTYGQQGASGGICRDGNQLNYTAARIAPVIYESNCDTIYIDLDLYARSGLSFSLVHRIRKGQLIMPFYGSGTFTGTPARNLSVTSTGHVIEVPEKWGAISTSTDASGDIVVAHGMGTTPTSVQVTVTGTTPYVVTVHTIDATNFTVRFYDMTGAAVASTAVTATWHCKT